MELQTCSCCFQPHSLKVTSPTLESFGRSCTFCWFLVIYNNTRVFLACGLLPPEKWTLGISNPKRGEQVNKCGQS